MSAAKAITPDVLVVGGGPAGLSAATTLRELGVDKVVLAARNLPAMSRVDLDDVFSGTIEVS